MKRKNIKKTGGIAFFFLLIMATIPFFMKHYVSSSLTNQKITQRAIQNIRARIIAENILHAAGESYYLLLEQDPTTPATTLQQQLNDETFRKELLTVAFSSDAQDAGFMVQTNCFHFKNNRIKRANTNIIENLASVVVGITNTITKTKLAIKIDYMVEEVPFLNYAIFTDGIFELSACPSMDVYGDVRSNDKIRIGGPARKNARLSFYGKLWTAKDIDIFKGWSRTEINAARRMRAKTKDGHWKDFLSSHNGVQLPLDSLHPNWDSESETRWGKNQIRDKVGALNVPIKSSDNHLLIEPPIETGTNKDDLTLRREKFAWKAKKPGGLRIHVESGQIKYSLNGAPFRKAKYNKNHKDLAYPGIKDPSTGVYQVMNPKNHLQPGEGWIQVDDSFVDRREAGTQPVRVVNLYMDNLIKTFPNVKLVYVEIEDNNGNLTPYPIAKKINSGTKLATLRIRNGNDLSAAKSGLTVATHRMAYVEGNYNVKDKIPSLIACDNLTMLSNAWNENTSKIKKTNASETWLQAALLVGGYAYSDSRPSRPINGLHNLVRFLEEWNPYPYKNPAHYHFLGSYVKLFNGKESNCASFSPAYFNAPYREVTYDADFINSPPPGMPTSLDDAIPVLWREISWDEAERFAGIKN